ncbi:MULTISPECIES: DUF6850 family outer membrane beta-barrel protein [Sphingobacterium]|uniref:DUF6850 domain-containing protein n=1 Tax=Sphingobacterium tenebrionis TaxID=3111775 RepID=A0ABU8I8H6_9SPHI|nr:DUF6850 family outer membrane beta-barrel protein [Sphingobacterium sp. 1.A.4]
MRLYLVIIWSLLTLPSCLYAQDERDSIYQSEIIGKLIKDHFLQHHLSYPKNFGEVELNYQGTSGDLRLAQEAYSQRNINFYAIGSNELGKFQISGDFLFNKKLTDSLSFGQRNDMEPWNPYSYYASKAGNYESQLYRSNFTLSYQLGKILRPFMQINYQYLWTTGSVDPRFDNKVFGIQYRPGLQVNVKNSSVALAAIIGNGRESQAISYKNKNYSQSLQYPDRIHYLSLGYGNNAIKDSLNNRKYTDLWGLEVSLHQPLSTNTSLDILSSLKKNKQEFTTDQKSTNKVYHVRGIYHEDQYFGSATLFKTTPSLNQYLNLKADYIRGYDFIRDLSADLSKSNYSVNVLNSSLNYLAEQQSPKPINFLYGLDLSYFQVHRQDNAQSIDVSNANLKIQGTFGANIKTGNAELLRFQINPFYRTSISDDLKYAANSMNHYIQQVVFWDYTYYKTNLLGAKLGAEWQSRSLFKQYIFAVKADYQIEQGKIKPSEYIINHPIGNLNRQQFQIGVKLYL